MKWLARAALGLLALLIVLVAGLAIVLPRFANDDAVRARIEAAARQMVGLELRYETIDFALLPPALHVEAPRLLGEAEGEPDFASADLIDLRVGLWPLLRGQFEVASFVVESLSVHLVRTEDGLVLPTPVAPTPAGKEASDAPSEAEATPDSTPAPEAGIMLGIGRIALRDGTIELEDRTLSPPAVTRFENLDITAEGGGFGDPIAVEGGFDVQGGHVSIDGNATLSGPLDLDVQLDALPLDALAPYAGLTGEWAGRLSGVVALAGETGDPSAKSDTLRIEEAAIEDGPLQLAGPVAMDFEVANLSSSVTGPFRVDLTDADLRYGVDFTKAPEVPAVVSGTLASDDAGHLAVDALKLVLRNLEATGSVRTHPSTQLNLQAPAFRMDGWESLVPPLGVAPLKGQLAIPALTLQTEPTRVEGALSLADLDVAVPDFTSIRLNGDIDLQGDALATQGLVATIAEQAIPLALTVKDLFGARDLELGFETKKADSDKLLTALADQPNRLHGPLDSKGTLRGRLSGEGSFTNTLNGRLNFEILKGKIVGGSLLEAVLGPLGSRLAELGRGQGGRDLQRFYGEEFERLSGVLRIAKGEIITEPVELIHREYGAELTGPIALENLALDLRGSFTFYEALDTELAKAFGARKGYTPRQRSVELASIQGEMGSPKVRLATNSATQLAAAYATDAQRGELRRKVDKELGEGTGEIVDRVLEGILGGR
ncbi:MAG: AsmA family protein [Myxococcota bacterium]